MSKPPRVYAPKHLTPRERLEYYGWDVTESGCWEWRGRRDKKGYGVIALKDVRQTFVHRVAYDVWCGGLDSTLSVCHSCDNPPCINPEHLFQGTTLDNIQDMTRKFRGNTTKLTEDSVRDIWTVGKAVGNDRKRRTAAKKELAAKYGVSRSAITKVWSRETWSVVTDEYE